MDDILHCIENLSTSLGNVLAHYLSNPGREN